MRNIFIFLAFAIFQSNAIFADTIGKRFYQREAEMQAKVKNGIMHKKMLQMKSIDKIHILGKFNPENDEAFIEASLKYANRKGLFVRKEAYEAFIKMHAAAKEADIDLTIVSATRNFYYQKGIWERKWNGQRIVEGKNLAKEVSDPVERARIILRYSSMPGTSRHHWGTDIDLNSVNNSYFDTPQGIKTYNWLKSNAANFGFCQTYTPKGELRPTGYEEEKWHWSYMPLAKDYLELFKNEVTYEDLKGFEGCEAAKQLQVIEKYVMAINRECLNLQ